jgi:Rod binding domain-containing protein
MGIRVSTDLVLDVMRAAEPQRLSAASQRLAGRTRMAAAETADPGQSQATKQAARARAHQQFEAVMLRSFTEQMMPKDTSSLYGEGTAADVWRSLQVDLMSQQIAKSGGIGIAKMLDRTAEKPVYTAESLGLNEMSGEARGSLELSSSARWPYFTVAAGSEA